MRCFYDLSLHVTHACNRDLKPENLLLDDDMRIKITDFGTGKILEQEGLCMTLWQSSLLLNECIDNRAGTFVGTAQYVSPELLNSNTTSKR